jgi:flavodoxin
MKTLVVYYSRTGTTKKVAEEIARKLKADEEEILDTVNRNGIWGWLKSGREGMKRLHTKLKRPKLNPADYDLVIIGTPIWVSVSSPVRTYLAAYKGKFKKVAFFCTMGSSGDEKAFKDMGEIVAKDPLATLTVLSKEVKNNDFQDKLEKFAANLK